MPATNDFFLWFYYGLSGLGGWFIFLLLALTAVIWLFYDSARRRLAVIGWRLGIALAAILIFPAILYRFTVNDVTDIIISPLGPFSEPIFYLGVLGGILPAILAIGYYISYQGMLGCPQGHVYEAVLGDCPHPDHLPAVAPVAPAGSSAPLPSWDRGGETAPPSYQEARPRKQHAQAWLASAGGRRNYQLYVDETRIGRSTRNNDIVLESDRSVSRESARILESNGHFRLYSLTASKFPRVNGHTVREPVLLEHDDDIDFGENTHLRFVKSQ